MNDMQAREAQARTILGTYTVKTAGGIMVSQARRVFDGWLYANSAAILFLADAPLAALPPSYPGLVDARTVLWPIAERPAHRLTAPFITPNGIIAFADGVEIVGAKKRIKNIAALLVR